MDGSLAAGLFISASYTCPKGLAFTDNQPLIRKQYLTA
jgi:hypothetical protein